MNTTKMYRDTDTGRFYTLEELKQGFDSCEDFAEYKGDFEAFLFDSINRYLTLEEARTATIEEIDKIAYRAVITAMSETTSGNWILSIEELRKLADENIYFTVDDIATAINCDLFLSDIVADTERSATELDINLYTNYCVNYCEDY